MDIISNPITDWLWDTGFGGKSLVAILILVGLFQARPLLKSQATRDRWQRWLAEDTIGKAYRTLMIYFLDWVDRKLSLCNDIPPNAIRRAWNPRVLNLALMLAIAYPILALFTQWVFGGTGKIGAMVVIEPTQLATRGWVFAWFAFASFLFWKSKVRQPSFRLWYRLAALTVLIGGTIFFLKTLGAFAIALAGAILGTFAIRGAVSGAFTIAFTSTFALFFTIIFEKVAKETATSIQNQYSLSASVAIAVLIAAILAGIIALSAHLLKPNNSNDKNVFLWFLFLAVHFGVSTAFLLWFQYLPSGGQNTQPTSILILFLVIFPMFNAFADFLSIGLTRWRLRIGLEKGGFLGWEAALDAFGAVVIFVILGISLIFYATSIDQNNGLPLLDLPQFFYDLQHHPENHAWLAFMLVSTLLPTLLHFIIASFAFFTIFPTRARHWASRGLGLAQQNGDAQLGLLGQLGLSAMIVLAFWVPVNLFWYGFSYHGKVSGWIIDGFAGFYHWIA